MKTSGTGKGSPSSNRSPSSSPLTKSDKNPLQSGVIELFKDRNGITQILLQHSEASATVSLLGAQVLSWKTKTNGELLFLSKKVRIDHHYKCVTYSSVHEYILNSSIY